MPVSCGDRIGTSRSPGRCQQIVGAQNAAQRALGIEGKLAIARLGELDPIVSTQTPNLSGDVWSAAGVATILIDEAEPGVDVAVPGQDRHLLR
jgi:hypothetical protein